MQNLYHFELFAIVKALILVIFGLFLARFAGNAGAKLSNKYSASVDTALIQKAIYFTIITLFIIAALQQLGFRLSVLLGSAGILTAALAFASQTSISNIISGIFLIMEKSFKIGDQIKVGGTTGTVASIDLLSVKILTAHNTLIRIPNETLIKSEITNVTKFDTRRLDLVFKVSPHEDVSAVKKVLLKVVQDNKLSLKAPSPSVSITNVDGTGISLQLSAWVKQADFEELSNNLYEQTLSTFKENHIQL